MEKNMDKQTMTLHEVKEYLGVTHQRVYQLLDAGRIRRGRGIGVFDAKSVVDYKLTRGAKTGRPRKPRGIAAIIANIKAFLWRVNK
jgi:hypothetical protein